LTVLAVLAGCTWFKGDEKKKEITGPNPATFCPRFLLLEDAGHLTTFGPGKDRTVKNIVFESRVQRYEITCIRKKIPRKSDTGAGRDSGTDRLAIVLNPEFTVKKPKGPAATVKFSYFVAAMDPRGKVLSRQRFPVAVKFKKDAVTEVVVDTVSLRLVLDRKQRTKRFSIFLGYQLTPEQLQFNRDSYGLGRMPQPTRAPTLRTVDPVSP